MKFNQVFALNNAIAKQMWGDDHINVVDTSSLVSMGDDVMKTDESASAYLGILADRINNVLVRTLEPKSYSPGLVMTTEDFGAIQQKLDIEPLEAQEDKSVEIGDDNFTSDYLKIFKPKISQKFFKSANVFKNTITIPRRLLKTAFTNPSEYGKVISGWMAAQLAVIERGLNNMEMLCIDHFIASKVHEGNGVYNLLTLYNAHHTGATLTAEQAIYNTDFLKYAGRTMRNIIKYMDDESVRFNAYGKVRRTRPEDLHVFLHTEFASAYTTYLESDTFHKELIALPRYQEVNRWQGTGNNAFGDYEDRTSINLKIGKVEDSTADNHGEDIIVNQKGIVGFFADSYALGVSNLRKWAGVDPNNGEQYDNYTQGAEIGLFNDLSENAVVFIIADTE